ncbi:protein kinase [Lujinxingia vulgaris]|uniref:Protein kinase n=1 Tax=Lujinxingia vulgaris TaxID=2600176 RepID=A0A5C6XKB6_9DELT|nr:serine/threonine-protein kinase [Lujinxingia vulgaris]TXD38580.1 protein kinase [Lujinxingia vulgaris]
MAAKFPQKFGPYTLHQLVARGGMAEIYRATMPGIGGFEKTVAIKKILPHLAENDEFITMLIDEANIIVSINHFNIAQVYDLGCIDDTYYIAMEYIHGVDLAHIIKGMARRGQTVPVPHAVYIGSSICAGLHVAHSKTDEQGNPLKIVHRDVSPHNVLLSYAGDVKIIDFGVAKAAVKESHTQHGVIKGKLLYMAPEQANTSDIDGRADLFAAGIIIYKMLTNRLPFEGDNEFQIYNNIMSKEITPPRILNPQVPEVVDQVVMKLLERDPDKRYQDGYSAKQDLDRALHQVAPGYTVNRLSRFIDENFSPGAEEARPASGPGMIAPHTPAGVSLNTGQHASADPSVAAGAEDERDTVDVGAPAFHAQMAAHQAQAGFSQPMRATTSAADTGEFPAAGGPAAPAQAAPAKAGKKIPPAAIAAAVMSLVVVILLVLVVMNGGQESQAPDPRSAIPADAIVRADDSAATENTPETSPEAVAPEAIATLRMTTIPEGARVFQDGELIGITPITLELPVSDETSLYELKLEGYEEVGFRYAPREDNDVDLELTALSDAGDEASSDEVAAANDPEPEPEPEPQPRRKERRREVEPEPQVEPEPEPEPEPQRDPPPRPKKKKEKAPEPEPEPERDDIIDPFAF